MSTTRCFVDLSLLVDLAACVGSYTSPQTQGLVFGTHTHTPSSTEGTTHTPSSAHSSDELHLKSALAWPLSAVSELALRTEHICLARRECECVGVWVLGTDTLPAHLPAELKVLVQVDPALFTSPQPAPSPGPETAHPAGSTLDLLDKMAAHPQVSEVQTLVQVRCLSGPNPAPLAWTLNADFPAFILFESMFTVDKLHQNIATTLPSFPDTRTAYSDADICQLVTVAETHLSKASQMFLRKGLAVVEETASHAAPAAETANSAETEPANSTETETATSAAVGDLASGCCDHLEPVLLRQLQFCTAEISALHRKKSSLESQKLTQLLEDTTHLAQLTTQTLMRMSGSGQKKHKSARRSLVTNPL